MDQYYQDNMLLGMNIYNFLHRYAVNGKVSGNLACISEIKNAAVVLYSPRGCGFHYRYHARSRNRAVYELECADLRNNDVIFGGEEKLAALLRKVEREQQPDLIFVLPSVVSDIVNDDMEGLVHSLQPQFKAKLVPITSQVFSHMDKSNGRKALREKACQQQKQKFSSSAVYPGCGYVEVMDALVQQVMEPQQVQPRSVNIEAFVWGFNGEDKLQGMSAMLRKMGIEVNAYLPAADLKTIQRAPRAALNIVRRKKWALAMEQRFGTPFLHVADMQEWHGLSGIGDLYRQVGELLGCRERVDQVLQEEYKQVEARYQELRTEFAKYKFCLIAHGVAMLPESIRVYEQDYGLPLSKICIIMNPSYQAESGLDDATMQKFKERIELAKAEYNCQAEVLLEPADDALREAAQSCDFVISNGHPRYASLGVPLLYNLFDRSVWTYQGFIDIMEEVQQLLQRPQLVNTSLLLSKLDYDPVFYPLRQEDADSKAARELFSRVWRQRK
ncbi:nitrogenase component 1 [Phascolarctobacterium sp.]|uniref:nitrogenase component 1 n=1 Tax=Phascolarctobacterium sp. TaxID=2049039 RepID=UPI0025F27BAA|nr:nitrogenase component 1 [Phascolarctobacterium sp.]